MKTVEYIDPDIMDVKKRLDSSFYKEDPERSLDMLKSEIASIDGAMSRLRRHITRLRDKRCEILELMKQYTKTITERKIKEVDGPEIKGDSITIPGEWFELRKTLLEFRSDITHVYAFRSKRQTRSVAQRKKLCAGCRNDRYNMGRGFQESSIDAPVNCDYCWSLPKALVVKKNVILSIYDKRPTNKITMSCWLR